MRGLGAALKAARAVPVLSKAGPAGVGSGIGIELGQGDLIGGTAAAAAGLTGIHYNREVTWHVSNPFCPSLYRFFPFPNRWFQLGYKFNAASRAFIKRHEVPF
jgi:hypothetical protein